MIETVAGELLVADAGPVLAAEVLLQAAPPFALNLGLPASEVAFAREPVTIENLGRLILGAPNRDDRTLTEADAAGALGAYSAAVDTAQASKRVETNPQRAQPVVVVLDASTCTERDTRRKTASLQRLSVASGVAIVRRTVLRVDATPAEFKAAAATAAGQCLALSAGVDLAEANAAVDKLQDAGLPGARVMLTGAHRLIGRRSGAGEGAGMDPDRLDGLLAFAQDSGLTICFDKLGRIPTVHTVVSDHDVAVAILRCAEHGIGDRITLSCGVRAKHQLTAFGGNGLEFITQQFLPYLGVLGADAALRAAVGGGNAERLLRRDAGGTT